MNVGRCGCADESVDVEGGRRESQGQGQWVSPRQGGCARGRAKAEGEVVSEVDDLRRELRGAAMIIAAVAKRQPDKTLRLSEVEIVARPDVGMRVRT